MKSGAALLALVLVGASPPDNAFGQTETSTPPAAPAPATSQAPTSQVQLAPQEIGPSPPRAAPSSGAASGVSQPAVTTPVAPETPATLASAMAAYDAALAQEKLGASEPLSLDRLRGALGDAEQKLAAGRRDEAIGDLVYLVESPRFDAFRSFDEGRNAIFLLGDALGRAAATLPSRAYLVPLIARNPPDVWARRAVRSLVDFGLDSDHPEAFLADLTKIPPGAPEEVTSDVAYLAGRTAERAGKDDDALAAFATVTPRSRFWAQATYLSGLIQVGRGQLKAGENQFCKVADVKQTPRMALAFGGGDFFEVRDLARLGLGRVAHEQFRFDDSRYYYYLVPTDSAHLPEALYESANSRYEAKDYRGARELLDEMRSRGDPSRYDDEFWIFDAYVDLALCDFPKADEKLRMFIARYEPVRDAARRIAADPHALADLVSAVRAGADPEALATRADGPALVALGDVLRADPDYGHTTRKLAELAEQMSGLTQTMAALDDARARLASTKDVRPRAEGTVRGTGAERAALLDAELAEVRRLIGRLRASGQHAAELDQLEPQLEALEARAHDAELGERESPAAAPPAQGLEELVGRDREHATALYGDAERTRGQLLAAQLGVAKDALDRLDLRLSRLLRRARLGRIETVLGKKRALTVEIEALSEGFLPQGAVDSLDAARYLRDDEEYWPYDGEDWADEYVGGEGLE